VRGHQRRKPTGRKPIPEHLPRVESRSSRPKSSAKGSTLSTGSVKVSEVVERRPASLVVARIIRPKFVRKARERDARPDVLIG
jgi:transposase